MKTTETSKTTETTSFEPPAGLSDASAELWRAIVPSRARTAGRLAMLEAALKARDRADAAGVAIDREGMTVTSPGSGVTHISPLMKVELENRRQFLSAMKSLSLEWSADDSR